MAGVPINFALPSENIGVNVSFETIANAEGYMKLYALQSTNQAGTATLRISTQLEISSGTEIGASTGVENLDFYSGIFNKTLSIEGEARICYSTRCTKPNTTGSGGYRVKCQIYKYSNSVLTQLGTDGYEQFLSAGNIGSGGIGNVATRNIIITLPKTKFNIGDQIVLRFVCTEDTSGGTNPTMYIGTDGERTTTSYDTRTHFYVPIKIGELL